MSILTGEPWSITLHISSVGPCYVSSSQSGLNIWLTGFRLPTIWFIQLVDRFYPSRIADFESWNDWAMIWVGSAFPTLLRKQWSAELFRLFNATLPFIPNQETTLPSGEPSKISPVPPRAPSKGRSRALKSRVWKRWGSGAHVGVDGCRIVREGHEWRYGRTWSLHVAPMWPYKGWVVFLQCFCVALPSFELASHHTWGYWL